MAQKDAKSQQNGYKLVKYIIGTLSIIIGLLVLIEILLRNNFAFPQDIHLYVVIIALVALLPIIIDLILSYWKGVEGGTVGIARTTMTITIIVILGIAVLLILTESINSEVVSTVLGALTATLAAITGFYFGGKTAESAAGAAVEKKVDEAAKKAVIDEVPEQYRK